MLFHAESRPKVSFQSFLRDQVPVFDSVSQYIPRDSKSLSNSARTTAVEARYGLEFSVAMEREYRITRTMEEFWRTRTARETHLRFKCIDKSFQRCGNIWMNKFYDKSQCLDGIFPTRQDGESGQQDFQAFQILADGSMVVSRVTFRNIERRKKAQ